MLTTNDTISLPPCFVPKAGRKQWIALAVLILPTLVVSMDFTVTYLAVPSISRALNPSGPQLLWITDIYGFLEAGFLITMGSLGDRIGRRKILLTGAFVFGIGSLLAAFSSTPGMLIASRGLLGLAGAAVATAILSLIRNMFVRDRERSVAISIWTTCFSVGTMLGPLAGGFLLNRFWWGSAYLMGIPAMILLLLTGRRLLPEYRNNENAAFDLPGSLLSVVAILSFIFGLKQWAAYGSGLVPFFTLAGGMILGWLFLRRLHRSKHPFIDLSLFRIPQFNAALTMLLAALFSWAGIQLFVAQYLQLVAGLDPLHAGLWTMPSAAGGALGCMLAPWAVRIVPRRWIMLAAMLFLVLGLAGIAQAATADGFALVIAGAGILSTGCGSIVTLGTDVVLRSAPPESAGAAAGMSETSTNMGSALGIALLGSIGAYFYRRHMMTGKSMELPPTVSEAARRTLGGALSEAAHLSGTASTVLKNISREAFMSSLVMTAAIAALLMLSPTAIMTRRWAVDEPQEMSETNRLI